MASGLFALDAADTTAGDGDGIGQGASIVLNKVGNDILGQVGAVTYFKISVDGNGVVTFAQLKNIWHPNTGSNDEAATLTLSDPALLQLTVTDADGDTASAGLNLGAGVFQIQDDGPTAAIVATGASVVMDELIGERFADSIGTADPNDTADDNVAGNPFPVGYGTPIGLLLNVDLVNTTTTTGSDDEGATTTVTLSIVGGNGTDSRLQTTDNRQISLFNESGVIVGRMDTAGGRGGPGRDGCVCDLDQQRRRGDGCAVSVAGAPDFPDNYDEAVNLGETGQGGRDGDGRRWRRCHAEHRDRQRDPVPGRWPERRRSWRPAPALCWTSRWVWMRAIRMRQLDDNVAGNPFPVGYGTPIGLLSKSTW